MEETNLIVKYGHGRTVPMVERGEPGDLHLTLPSRDNIFGENDLERMATKGDFIPVEASRGISRALLRCLVIMMPYSEKLQLKNDCQMQSFSTEDGDRYHMPNFVDSVIEAMFNKHTLNVGIAKTSSKKDRNIASAHRQESKISAERERLSYHQERVADYVRMADFHRAKAENQQKKIEKLTGVLETILARNEGSGG
jgi:hypothetical protein